MIALHSITEALTPHVEKLARGGAMTTGPVHGSLPAVLATMLAAENNILFITAHAEDADETYAMLQELGMRVSLFPALEFDAAVDLLAMRLAVLDELKRTPEFGVIVAPISAIMQMSPSPSHLPSIVKVLYSGSTLELSQLQHWLVEAGYERRESIEESGQFAMRGGILDIACSSGEFVRLDFFGDTIESIHEVDPISLGSDRKLEEVILTATERGTCDATLVDHLSSHCIAILDDLEEVARQARSYIDRVEDTSEIAHYDDVRSSLSKNKVGIIGCCAPPANAVDIQLPSASLPQFDTSATKALAELNTLAQSHHVTLACRTSGEAQRMRELLEPNQPLANATHLNVLELFVHRGFVVDQKYALVPSHEVFHRYEIRRGGQVKTKSMRQALSQFDVGDLVVHRDHGIALYAGMHQVEGQGSLEFLSLEFSGGKRLHVPATHAHLVQRYVGAFKGRPELSSLGGTKWSSQKEKAKEAVVDLASELMRVQAIRETSAGIAFPPDTTWMQEFESSFPWDETEDQLDAIGAMKRDMESPRAMDRLVCGDVGFGKTEIAIRGAFKAAESGRQVAVLVPTTVLAIQHEKTFQARLADYPFVVESLTRFHTTAEQKEILERVAAGEVDVLIGTHRILSQDVSFNRLGLVVVDEEQRFGVEHKQRLLSLRAEADVLTLTATPIPRTLHMALVGIRDISSLQTPPVDRRSVVTEVTNWDSHRIARDIRRELAREGQTFYVHNRVYDIESVAEDLRTLVPEATVIVGHGQMPTKQLQRVMAQFVQGEADVFVSTTIIESGIDIPNANTMFIADADRFGLSDLHQLRGRVGRFKHRAFCTLLLPKDRLINPTARKRLHAIEQFSMLGSGFQIALRDLEIRGAGNLLGAEQSGHIAAVGYEMYCQLLDKAVSDLKEGKSPTRKEAMIGIGVRGRLPKAYIASEPRRLVMYRRLAEAHSIATLSGVLGDLQSAYGDFPPSVATLIQYHELRITATLNEVESIMVQDADVVIRTSDPQAVEQVLRNVAATVRRVGQRLPSGTQAVFVRPAIGTQDTLALLVLFRDAFVQSGS
ncbi:MAG: transcription-repair coupling factor [Phycisphaerales bacterium]|nr:transcription-repair coupling factor [Phycisphaerales bacterium]